MGWIHLPQVGEIQLCVPSFGKTLAASSLGAVGRLGGWVVGGFLSKFPRGNDIQFLRSIFFGMGGGGVFWVRSFRMLDHPGLKSSR